MDEQEEFEFRLRHEREQAQAKPEIKPEPTQSESIGKNIRGQLEAGLSIATGIPASIAGNVAGIYKGLTGGKLGTPEGVREASERAREVSQRFTYSPRTEEGRTTLQDVGNVLHESKLAGLGPTEAISLSAFAPAVSAERVPLSNISKMNPVKARTWEAAQAEGYVVPPSAIGGGFASKRLESVGGKAAVSQEAALRNQQITNKIAAREAGLAEGADITEGTLAKAREQIAAPYNEVSKVSPVAAQAFERLKTTQNEAKQWWQHYQISKEPPSLKEAERLDSLAANLEKLIDKEATRAGRPDLLPALREARVNFAKNYDVEKALNLGTGDVDAHVIGRMLDKRGEKAMTGGLQVIGKFAQAFKPYSRAASNIPTPGVSKSEALASAGFGMMGHASGLGWLPAGLPLVSGPARSIALSKLMQNPSTGSLSGILNRPVQASMVPLSEVAPYSRQE